MALQYRALFVRNFMVAIEQVLVEHFAQAFEQL